MIENVEPEVGRLAPQAPKSFAAFVADDAIGLVTTVAAEIGAAGPLIVRATVAEAVRQLAGMTTPRRLVIDLSGSIDPLAAIDSLAEVCDAGTEVTALGEINDVELYRNLIRRGVQDYLVKPVLAPALAAALTHAVREPRSDTAAKPGRLIAVVGARGGVGATTVAVNVAWTLANEQGMRVVLVDFDLFFGTCALALDLETGHGFRDAMEHPGRMDSLFIQRSMVRQGSNLFVLSTEEALDGALHVDPSAMESLMEHLRRDFECVVIDFPRHAARRQARLLTPPSSAVVVSDPSLAGMRDTMRLVQLLKRTVPDADLSVTLNRVGANKFGELGSADFAKGAETKVDCTIPFEVKAFAASAAVGTPVVKVAGRTKAAEAMRILARTLGGGRAAKAPLPGWKRLLRGGR
jgi:pilus assembly protein CpaE